MVYCSYGYSFSLKDCKIMIEKQIWTYVFYIGFIGYMLAFFYKLYVEIKYEIDKEKFRKKLVNNKA